MPFHGSTDQAARAVQALLDIDRLPGDELIVVDNSGTGAVAPADGVRVVVAHDEQSAYYARNVGAELAANEWLLFVDADCRPRADILERYLAVEPGAEIGAVIGEVVGVAEQDQLTARYARSRGHLGQRVHWEGPFRPWGVTANLLVRRKAWASVGGFHEGIRSAGDTEFSWRLQDAGWKLAYRPEAEVEHWHRESVSRLVRQAARYGAGRAWVVRRYPRSVPEPRLARPLARSALGIVVWTLTGRFERAAFKALDATFVTSEWFAYRLSNTSRVFRRPQRGATVGLVAGAFPAAGDPAVAGAREQRPACIDAASRPVRVDRAAARTLPIAWVEDDGTLRRLGAVASLAVRRPLPVARYLTRRRRSEAPLLRDVSTRALRMADAGVREVRPLVPEARREAEAIATLLGLRSR